MGQRARKRQRKARAAGEAAPVATSDYADADGNVLTLRDSISAGSAEKLRKLDAKPAASAEDRWQRRNEFLFERFATRWVIAGLPIESQKQLLGRYRMANADERRWVRETLDRHLETNQPELLA